jgi:hypothetical protein
MSALFDQFTRTDRTGTSNPTTVSHTPIGVPRGVFLIAQCQTPNLHLVNGTYGGVAVPSISQMVGATKTLEVCFLGSGVPVGTQDAVFEWDSATTDDIELMVVTVTSTGGYNIEVVDVDGLSASGSNSAVTMNANGRVCTSFGWAGISVADPTDAPENGNMTPITEIDKGASIYLSHYQTTPSDTDFVFGYTHSSAPRVMIVLAIAEIIQPGFSYVPKRKILQRVG